MRDIKVAFVCVHNSCRSQMAEGWAKKLAPKFFDVYSAGTEQSSAVHLMAVQVMKECGIDISMQRSKLISEIPSELDIIITMGCDVVLPFTYSSYVEDWEIPNPVGGTLEDFRYVRDLIKSKVLHLIDRVGKKTL